MPDAGAPFVDSAKGEVFATAVYQDGQGSVGGDIWVWEHVERRGLGVFEGEDSKDCWWGCDLVYALWYVLCLLSLSFQSFWFLDPSWLGMSPLVSSTYSHTHLLYIQLTITLSFRRGRAQVQLLAPSRPSQTRLPGR